MRERPRITLGKKIVAMVAAMAVTLCATALFVGYRAYGERITEFYTQQALSAAVALASQLTAEELDDYYRTQETDRRYDEIQSFAKNVAESHHVVRLWVVRPSGSGMTFLFDVMLDREEEREDCPLEEQRSLGTHEELTDDYADYLALILEGKEADPILQGNEDCGRWMTVGVPVCHEDGTAAGYVMADISVEGMVREQRQFLLNSGGLLALLALAYAAVFLLIFYRSFIQPIRQLTQAALKYEGGEEENLFRQVEIRNNDELKSLASAFRMMLVEINLNNMEQKELAVREQQVEAELQLARELNISLLPRALPEREGGYPFAVQGHLEQGQELSYCFYDYFLLDGERLCLLLGEVSGHGTPQAIYTVMAQATIKSQMRSGQTLAAAITAANRQLYEAGRGMSIQVLAGVLEWTTGRFSYINAGQQIPLIMRSQEYYEWGRDVSYAPLGQSENVSYQVEQLELRQGDRLLFHTRGLDEIRDREGIPFAREQLRVALNRKSSRRGELDEQLHLLSAAAGAYAGRPAEIEGYALMALEYRRRDKAQAHCLLSQGAAGSAALTAFLRGQLEANGLRGGQMAQIVVLADEVFTLCCRCAPQDSHIMTECAVPPAEDLLILRFRGDFGGINPLEHLEAAAENAAVFIRTHCDQLLFEHTAFVDTVTVVKHLGIHDQTEKDGGTRDRREANKELVLQ